MILLLMLVFVLGTIICVVATIIGYAAPDKPVGRKRRWFLATLLGLAVAYMLALGLICLDPYYDDNGAREAMVFPQHLFWALDLASLLQLLTVPLGLWLRSVVGRRLDKRAEPSAGGNAAPPRASA